MINLATMTHPSQFRLKRIRILEDAADRYAEDLRWAAVPDALKAFGLRMFEQIAGRETLVAGSFFKPGQGFFHELVLDPPVTVDLIEGAPGMPGGRTFQYVTVAQEYVTVLDHGYLEAR